MKLFDKIFRHLKSVKNICIPYKLSVQKINEKETNTISLITSDERESINKSQICSECHVKKGKLWLNYGKAPIPTRNTGFTQRN